MKKSIWLSVALIACNSTGSVVLDPEGNIVDDTGAVDVNDTGDAEDTDESDTEDTEDSEDTNDTEDTEDTQDTDDTEEPVEIPEDNNNPNIYPNYWEGTRVLTYDGCSETITEYGTEVTEDFTNWLSVCNCDELYYVQVDKQAACGLPVSTAFYRAIKYNGFEMDILYYPETNPEGPYEPSLLATATITEDGQTWSYEYSAQTASGTANLDGLLNFFFFEQLIYIKFEMIDWSCCI